MELINYGIYGGARIFQAFIHTFKRIFLDILTVAVHNVCEIIQ